MRKWVLFFMLMLPVTFVCRAQLPEMKNIYATLPQIKDSLRYVDALNRLAMLLYEKNIDSTFLLAKQAREISNRLQYAKGKADALNNLGVVYDIKGNLQLGLRYYNEAYKSYTLLKDTANRAQARMNIAQLYQESGKNEKAVANYKMAMGIGKKLRRDSIMAMVIYNFLYAYPDEVNKDSVDFYFNKARKIGEKYKDTRILLALDQLEANIDFRENRVKKGLALLTNTLDTVLKNHLYYFSLDILINLGDHLLLTDTAKAISYYKQGLTIADKNGYLIYSQVLTRKLRDFYRVNNNSKNELYYSRLLIAFNDKHDLLDNESGVDYMDYAVKEQQLESVKLRSQYKSVFLALTVVVCLMAVVLIMILWRNWKKTQKNAALLRLQFEQAEAATEALDVINKNYARLIKIVAHDLRNPIGAMSTISSILVDKSLGDENDELIKMMQVSADNSLNLIGDLLNTDFEEQQEPNKQETDLNVIVEQCVQLLNFRAKDKNQQINLTLSAEPVIINLDKEKINRVINNLITNALKFSPDGEVIYVAVTLAGNTALLTVKDAGIGIPDDIQRKIFDPFTTAKRMGTGGEQPFGLGLYISKQIIEAHHGKIGVKSEPGAGTEFFVLLNLAKY
ncbi:ATP-binding protein [Mucilaginibacter phyllosphaerae]